MDPATIGPIPYPFRGEGGAKVKVPRYAGGRVWINRTQHFADVPGLSSTFVIGGCQPAQKRLTDRKERALSLDDARHCQQIIGILAETDRIMPTIPMTPWARAPVKARSTVPHAGSSAKGAAYTFRPPQRDGHGGTPCHRPFHTGSRFSAKARAPSR
jgi:hypothetical protein